MSEPRVYVITMPALLPLLSVLATALALHPARAQTCGTYAVAAEAEDGENPMTARVSRGDWGSCLACPAGQLGANPEDNCQACGSSLDHNVGPQLRGEWGACTGCPKGSYAATVTDDCQFCGDFENPATNPPFGTTATSGATSVSQCMCRPGFTYVISEEVCGECQGGQGVPGFYKSTYGNEACTQCPADGETENIGSTSSSDCKCGAGYRYDASDSASPCKFCPANQFKPLVENAECTSCPEGSSVAQATDSGSLVRSILGCICDAGRERNSANNQCDICPAGKYRAASSSNDDRCIAMTSPARNTCGQGSAFSSASANADDLRGATANDGECAPCPEGKIKPGSGATACFDQSEIHVTAPKGLSPGYNDPWPFTFTLNEDADANADLFFSVEPLLGSPFVPQKVVLKQDALDTNGDPLGTAGTHTITIGPLSTLAADQANIMSVTPSDGSSAFDIPHSSPNGYIMSITAQFTGAVSGSTSPTHSKYTNIWKYDALTETPKVTRPAANSSIPVNFDLVYSFLGDQAKAGTLTLTIRARDVLLDAAGDRVIVFDKTTDGSINNFVALSQLPGGMADVQSINTAADLVPGASYDFVLSYQDQLGNAAANTSIFNVLHDVATEPIVMILPGPLGPGQDAKRIPIAFTSKFTIPEDASMVELTISPLQIDPDCPAPGAENACVDDRSSASRRVVFDTAFKVAGTHEFRSPPDGLSSLHLNSNVATVECVNDHPCNPDLVHGNVYSFEYRYKDVIENACISGGSYCTDVMIVTLDAYDDTIMPIGDLTNQVNKIDEPNLRGVQSVTLSPDGKNLYAVAWSTYSIVYWDRDPATGILTNQVNERDPVNTDGLTSVAMSPEGTNVYAVALDSKNIVHWDRNLTTGALTNRVHASLSQSYSVTVSPDGENVYAVLHGGAIVHWDRDLATGALTNQVTSELDQANLLWTRSVTVSPDGKNVYAAVYNSRTIVYWDRNPATGALTNQINVHDYDNLDGAYSVTVSPDGKNVYAAVYNSRTIVYWDRNPATGALTNQINIHDYDNLDGARSVTVSPDGKNVYAAVYGSKSIVYWDRNPGTGALTNQVNKIDATNLDGARSVTLSPDGKNVYAVSGASFSIVHWDRKVSLPAYLTGAPSLFEPASGDFIPRTFKVSFELKEDATADSVKLIITPTGTCSGGSSNSNGPHTLELSPAHESLGVHNITVPALSGAPTDRNSGNSIDSVSPVGVDLVDGCVYSMRIEYQNRAANPVTSDLNRFITFDTTKPTADSAILDLNNGLLTITFSESINVDGQDRDTYLDGDNHPNTIHQSIVMKRFKLSQADLSSEVSLGQSTLLTTADGTTVQFQLTEDQRITAIAFSGTPGGDGGALKLDVFEKAFFDRATNPNGNNFDVTVIEIADTVKPNITSAFIDYSTGTLRLQASEKLNLKTGVHVDLGKVFISNTNGAAIIDLTGATLTDTDSSEVTIVLTEEQRAAAIAISDTPGGGGKRTTGDGSAIFVDILDNAFQDIGTTASTATAVTHPTGLQATETTDSTPPIILFAALDLNSGELTLQCSETLDLSPTTSNVDLSGIYLANISGDKAVTLAGAAIGNVADDTTLTVFLTETQRAAALAISGTSGGDGTALVLDMNAGALVDISQNENVDNANIQITETPDTTKPFVVSGMLDLHHGLLVITASETLLDRHTEQLAPQLLSKLTLVNHTSATGADTISLAGAQVQQQEQRSMKITIVLTEQQRLTARALSGTPGGDNSALSLKIDVGAMKDMAENSLGVAQYVTLSEIKEDTVLKLVEKVVMLESTLNTESSAVVTLEGQVDALETTSAAEAAKTVLLEAKVQSLESISATEKSKVETLETTTAAQHVKVTGLETTSAAEAAKTVLLEAKVQSLESISATVETLENETIASLVSRVTTLEESRTIYHQLSLALEVRVLNLSAQVAGIGSTNEMGNNHNYNNNSANQYTDDTGNNDSGHLLPNRALVGFLTFLVLLLLFINAALLYLLWKWKRAGTEVTTTVKRIAPAKIEQRGERRRPRSAAQADAMRRKLQSRFESPPLPALEPMDHSTVVVLPKLPPPMRDRRRDRDGVDWVRGGRGGGRG